LTHSLLISKPLGMKYQGRFKKNLNAYIALLTT
jgi:hypothetical protein